MPKERRIAGNESKPATLYVGSCIKGVGLGMKGVEPGNQGPFLKSPGRPKAIFKNQSL